MSHDWRGSVFAGAGEAAMYLNFAQLRNSAAKSIRNQWKFGYLFCETAVYPVILALMQYDNTSQLRRKVTALLNEKGITSTRQRVEIGLRLFDRDKHVTADQLLDEVNRASADVSRATVYNTLGLFAQHGLIREVVIDADKHVYDTNTSAHHHIYNVDTGELKDINSETLEVLGVPALDQGLVVDSVDIIVRVRNDEPA